MDSTFVLLIIVALVVVFATIMGVVVWTALRVHRAGSLQNLLLGGRVLRSFDELACLPTVPLTTSRVQVHLVDTKQGKAIGVTLTQSGPGFWRRTGFTLPAQGGAELITQLSHADAQARAS